MTAVTCPQPCRCPDIAELIAALASDPPVPVSDVPPAQGRRTAVALGIDADDMAAIVAHIAGP
jgi:hypothetical protein